MAKNASPNADKTPQTLPEAPFATFIQLDGNSPFHRSFVIGDFYDHPAPVAGWAS
jgi:hypothetical protein